MAKFFTNDYAVNRFLGTCKHYVDTAFENKDVPKELKELSYLVFAGMYSFYGDEYLEDIFKTFRDTRFLYSKNGTIEEISKLDITPKSIEFFKNNNATAFCELYIKPFEDIRSATVDRSVILYGRKDISKLEFMENMVHELNHVLNSRNKPKAIIKGVNHMRLGMSYKEIDGTGSGKTDNKILLEETFNTLQSAEIMNCILGLVDFNINDPEIERSVSKFRPYSGVIRTGCAYDYFLPILRPLYQNRDFNFVMKKSRMSGYVREIGSDFDLKVGTGSFGRLAVAIDGIGMYSTVDNYRTKRAEADQLVKQYVSRRG